MEKNIWRCGKGSWGEIERKGLIRVESLEFIEKKYLPKYAEYLSRKIDDLEKNYIYGFGSRLTEISGAVQLIPYEADINEISKLKQILLSSFNSIKTGYNQIPFERLDRNDTDLLPPFRINHLIEEMELYIEDGIKNKLELIDLISSGITKNMRNYNTLLKEYIKELRKIPGYENQKFKSDSDISVRWGNKR